jgi:hypothetical protein
MLGVCSLLAPAVPPGTRQQDQADRETQLATRPIQADVMDVWDDAKIIPRVRRAPLRH